MADAFLFTVLAICGLALVRNELVYRLGTRRLHEISDHADALIAAGRFDEWRPLYEAFHAQGYIGMAVDLRKWTYRQFFPEVLS